MATLFLSSSFLLPLSSHKLWQWHPPRKHLSFTICCASSSSSNKSASSSSSSSRSSRKVKSNEELYNDLREFLSTVGLSESHVPSMKELSAHGRDDLANIVRRRGYKYIRQLLKSSTKPGFNGFVAEKSLAESLSDPSFVGEVSPNLNGHYEKADMEEKVANFIQNGDLDIIDDRAMILNGSALTSKQIASFATVNHPLSEDHLGTGVEGADFDSSEVEVIARRRENQLEIDHLKFMLHQKEMELSRLKEQIEKEKLALSVLQTKAVTEINKAEKLISDKDEELIAAEESLSGLEVVEIQYSGDGEIVEVAGSFNGWHHRIKMDPLPSSSIIEPIRSRKSRLWSTVLWLYPGTYEIKFIVDGQWKVDPQRESVTKGGICNNILRVI
ncbi:protein PTST homolog 3, chloroplastic isoform X12 [Citrus sinensis]|uniref:protein PTST homolog 3, chloroplastic isoform X12 n=1 Tax=Citrus sinensis TaxID=2711 RepID=UPI0003D7454D|nr:protein PTST homolog 3, chloroplastic isoform X12 [Citrus sinensis]